MPDRIGATNSNTGKTARRRASRGAATKDLASMGKQAIQSAPKPTEKTMNQHVDQKNLRIEPVAKPASPLMPSAATPAVSYGRSGTSEAKLLQLQDYHRKLLEQRVR